MAFWPGREEKELRQELQAIRRFVRQTWIMMIVLLVVIVVPTVLVWCSLLGVVLVEFLPQRVLSATDGLGAPGTV